MVKVVKIGEEEELEVAENELTQVPAPVEEPVADDVPQVPAYVEEPATSELEDYKIKQKFVKKVYYTLIGVLYFTFCGLFNYYVLGVEYYGQEISFEVAPLLWFFLDTFVVALIIPIGLLVLSFASGGILFGVLVGLTYGLFGLLSRGIMKILGFDLELIFPELVGHTGVVSKPNVLGKFTTYNLSVEIEKAGLYGNSFWHGNNIAAKSKVDEIPVGTKVRVIEADYWSLSSLLRNSPVIVVVPDEEDIDSSLDDGALDNEEVKPEVVDNVLDTGKVNEGMGLKSAANWTVKLILLLTGIIFILFGLSVLMTCSMSSPPQCGTLIEASPCFSVSIICFILYFYLGRVEE